MSREIHGATPMAGTKKEPLLLVERDTTIIVRQHFTDRFELSAEAARWMAKKLNRLALRIERRASLASLPTTTETGK